MLLILGHGATAQVAPAAFDTTDFHQLAPLTTATRTHYQVPYRGTGIYIEQMPTFEGGIEGLLCFLHQNNQLSQPGNEYPSGKVFVGFIVDTAGHVQGAQILKGLHPALDAEALRLVNLLSGRFTPGRQNKRPVAVPFTLPIQFPATMPTGRKQLKRFKRCASSFTANTR
ncbi:energy transducer TonB [Hymenobacter perfusus]|uniref:energy transducer TonB n=1 Tax=Hymenobacter perfusus TaxID=1236770 RepID=UPI001476F1B1|nr:energy transducer TonB [Hymenobacter perfusus]